jgi:hypothetical protein
MSTKFAHLRYLSGWAKGYNFLRAFSIFSALMLLLSITGFSIVKPLYLLLYNKVRDGYYLVLLSPVVLLTWILASLILVVIYFPVILLFCLCGVSTLYGLIFELPSDFINRNRENREKRYDLRESLTSLVLIFSPVVVVLTPLLILLG